LIGGGGGAAGLGLRGDGGIDGEGAVGGGVNGGRGGDKAGKLGVQYARKSARHRMRLPPNVCMMVTYICGDGVSTLSQRTVMGPFRKSESVYSAKPQDCALVAGALPTKTSNFPKPKAA